MSNSCSFLMHKVKSFSAKNITTKNESTVANLECGSGSLDELQKLLDLLNTTDNVDMLSKLFSAISAYLMFHNRSNIDKIIKYSAVYEKLCVVISKGLPRKVTEALNFLAGLLYVEVEQARSARRMLAMHARHTTRVSGCLGTMADMFCNGMMYIDVWKALCQCLAVACDRCEMNQSYCTHLVPLCIRKCSQENIDVLLVLQSLLYNHNRNVELFLKSNGLTVFTRELLHYDNCLSLLTTLAQSSVMSPLLFRGTQILENLYDFIRLYGPQSQIGQKAMIILNHIDARTREINLGEKTSTTEATKTTCNDNDPTRRYTKSNNKDCTFENLPKTDYSVNTSVLKAKDNFDETSILMQNLMKEVFRMKQEEMRHSKKSVIKKNVIGKLQSIINTQVNQKTATRNTNSTVITNNEVRRKTSTEWSFSFLDPIAPNSYKNSNIFNNKNDSMNISNISVTDINRYENRTDTDELKKFIPIYVSTPKHLRQTDIDMTHKDNTQITHTTKTQNIPKRMFQYETQKRTMRQNILKGVPKYETELSNIGNDAMIQNIPKRVPKYETELSNIGNDAMIQNIPRRVPKYETELSNIGNDAMIQNIRRRVPKYETAKRKIKKDIVTQNIPKRGSKYETEQRKIINDSTSQSILKRVSNYNIRKRNDTTRNDTDMKHKTLGSRFLSAINESCSTLAKTVKNIFVRQKNDRSKDTENIDEKPHTEFSFTNYMKKRDAVMNDMGTRKKLGPTNFSMETDSCKTCDDTQVLRLKMMKDEHLKETIRKLKLGINLYGCDFKKISKTMWPRESYVTPAVLYHLYRKLIMK